MAAIAPDPNDALARLFARAAIRDPERMRDTARDLLQRAGGAGILELGSPQALGELGGMPDASRAELVAVRSASGGPNPRRELREIRRVLRPGGQLLLGSGGDASPPGAEQLLRELGFERVRSVSLCEGGRSTVWTHARR